MVHVPSYLEEEEASWSQMSRWWRKMESTQAICKSRTLQGENGQLPIALQTDEGLQTRERECGEKKEAAADEDGGRLR